MKLTFQKKIKEVNTHLLTLGYSWIFIQYNLVHSNSEILEGILLAIYFILFKCNTFEITVH